LDGKLNAKLSPNLGFKRSDIGFVQPLKEELEPFGNKTIFTYLNKNNTVKTKTNVGIFNLYLQLP